MRPWVDEREGEDEAGEWRWADESEGVEEKMKPTRQEKGKKLRPRIGHRDG